MIKGEKRKAKTQKRRVFTFLLFYLFTFIDYGKFKITRKGYRHLWYEQYHRQILELSACATLHG